jgi:hypothetical protein
MKGFLSKIFGGGDKNVVTPPVPAGTEDPNNPQEPNTKKGFFGKLAGMFKDDKGSSQPAKPPDNGQAPPPD